MSYENVKSYFKSARMEQRIMESEQSRTMKQYIVDAFTNQVFSGNPAAICILDQWIPESLMMSMTQENNLSETAFAVKEQDIYHLRWFTPGGEIDLCGHATLACAYVILRFYETGWDRVSFQTKSGMLTVKKEGEFYEMDFPAYELNRVEVTNEIAQAVGIRPVEAWMGRDLVCVLEDEQHVLEASPELTRVRALDGLLMHLTAKGKAYDCISRSFAPKLNVTEDPVCGSGHCHIVPYWAKKMGKEKIKAYQASARGGILYCRTDNDRVILGGQAALYSVSDVYVEVR